MAAAVVAEAVADRGEFRHPPATHRLTGLTRHENAQRKTRAPFQMSTTYARAAVQSARRVARAVSTPRLRCAVAAPSPPWSA